MQRPARSTRLLAECALIALLLPALLGWLAQRPGLQEANLFLYDRLLHLRRPAVDPGIAIIGIDAKSLAALGPWPWPRYYLARLVEKIAMQKPRAIAFDMIFSEPDRLNPDRFVALYPELDKNAAAQVGGLMSMDQAFATVLGRNPVVLGRLGIEADGVDPKRLFVDPAVGGRPPPRTTRYRQVLASIPEIDDVEFVSAVRNVGCGRLEFRFLIGREDRSTTQERRRDAQSGKRQRELHGRPQ